MRLLSFILQVLHKVSSDSTFQSIGKIDSRSLYSIENPLLFSLILVVIILAVSYIYYRYVIIPLKKKHLQEEENMRLQQAELMALFAELSPDPIFRFDETGKIILANNSAHNIFPDRRLVGEKAQVLFPFLNDSGIRDVISNAGSVNYTYKLGERFFQFIIEGVSKLNICQVYGRDISELKHTEQELKEALLKAEEAKQLKEFFLAQISHEIRAPLNVIVGYSDILAEELKNFHNDEFYHILRSMKNNSKRLYRTFDLLLNMSQLQTGRYDARFERVDLLPIFKTIQSDFNSLAEEKKLFLNLNNNLEEDTTVSADHYSVTQIFINLIDNAIKYSNSGGIDITLYRDGFNKCIDISDTGKGMSKDYIKKLFMPFSQEEMGYTRRFEGTGLGLAIVKSFADLNRAKIGVRSEVDKGTTFTITFNGEKLWGLQ
jgi:signal transduction histidine kinase